MTPASASNLQEATPPIGTPPGLPRAANGSPKASPKGKGERNEANASPTSEERGRPGRDRSPHRDIHLGTMDTEAGYSAILARNILAENICVGIYTPKLSYLFPISDGRGRFAGTRPFDIDNSMPQTRYFHSISALPASPPLSLRYLPALWACDNSMLRLAASSLFFSSLRSDFLPPVSLCM